MTWRVVRWRMPGGEAADDYYYAFRRVDERTTKLLNGHEVVAHSDVSNLKREHKEMGDALKLAVLELMPSKLVEVPSKRKP